MGTWGTGIKENDSAADVYDEYFDLYNDGKNPKDIIHKMIADNEETIASDSASDFWLPLALALWETNALSEQVFEKVTSIINSGSDIANWKELDGSDEDIAERKNVLDDFYKQISQPNTNPLSPNQPREEPYPNIEIKLKPEAKLNHGGNFGRLF